MSLKLIESALLLVIGLSATLQAGGQDAPAVQDGPPLPTLEFFYYDSAKIEWVVSAEPDRLEKHLQSNAQSARLFQSLSAAISEEADLEQVRLQMARWLENERGRLADARGNVVRLRKAEGIGAYMRAHEFRMDQLVEALLKHSGASSVEIAAVHLARESGNSSFQLKIMLPGETIGIGGQGFNVVFGSPDMTYTGVVYALALALYEVHEMINAEAAEGAEAPPDLDLESLPPPVPSGPRELGATQDLTTTDRP